MPQQGTKSVVMKANFFQFYNESDSKYCWLTYIGPTKILVNSTNNCYTSLAQQDLRADIVKYTTCLNQDQTLIEPLKHHDPQYCKREAYNES